MLFSSKKEEEVESLINKHVSVVEETILNLKNTMNAFIDNDKEFKDLSYKVHLSEHEADVLRRNIERKFYEGAFLPHLRESYIELVEGVDKIADKCEATADLIVLTRPKIPEFIKEELKTLFNPVTNSFLALKKSMEIFLEDIDLAREQIQKVSFYEEEADKIEWSVLNKLFKEESVSLGEKLLLRDLIIDISSVADRAEDASDLLEIMIVNQKL